MRYEPVIRLNYDLLERMNPKDKREFAKANQPGVFKYDDASCQLIVLNAAKVRAGRRAGKSGGGGSGMPGLPCATTHARHYMHLPPPRPRTLTRSRRQA